MYFEQNVSIPADKSHKSEIATGGGVNVIVLLHFSKYKIKTMRILWRDSWHMSSSCRQAQLRARSSCTNEGSTYNRPNHQMAPHAPPPPSPSETEKRKRTGRRTKRPDLVHTLSEGGDTTVKSEDRSGRDGGRPRRRGRATCTSWGMSKWAGLRRSTDTVSRRPHMSSTKVEIPRCSTWKGAS